MKNCSSPVSFSQSFMSFARSISSAVQNEACAFLNMSHNSLCLIGKITKRDAFSWSMGSAKSSGCGSRGISKAVEGCGGKFALRQESAPRWVVA